MGRLFLQVFVIVCCTECIFVNAQQKVQTVTYRHDNNDVPDFLRGSTEAPSPNSETSTTKSPPTTPELTREQKDELRFKSVTGTEPTKFWMDVGQSALKMRLEARRIEKVAKNIIFFVGDGMSVPTIAGARIFKGQSEGLKFGEEAQLHMEKFPYLGASRTFCSDAQVADSACSATALFTGSKTNYKTIGVSPNVLVGDCIEQMKSENQLSSILQWAQKVGKSTGIVTTTRITHATPAGTYAHISHRDWENDAEILKAGFDTDKCDDIAEQLILREPGKNINVILGGGRKHLIPSSVVDFESGQKGMRNDSKNLIDIWKENNKNKEMAYVDNVEDLLKVDTKETDYLLGLFSPDHIEYADNITANNDPSLLNMTRVAIQILSKNPNGFFLMVEGGRIDHALHDAQAQRALREALELDQAIKLADDMTEDEDTLIVVTADHSHVMSIAGYPVRGNNILGVAQTSDVDELPYTTISFANGPGFRNHTNGLRPNVSADDFLHVEYKYYSGVPLKYETHGGDDVFIFSKGPYAHLLTGVNLQNYIPHVMAYAACIGPEGSAQSPFCKQTEAAFPSGVSSASSAQLLRSFSWQSVLLVLLLVSLRANSILCSSL